ncbi:mastermind-like protein 1 [Latimeria chalumnae]|uniref:Mastermind like transcriptional coactivator 1 n=1 Tax=Latimeria chalumnae TaxID=7897 RepID=H3ARX7_LATCH|nr:PREDICTED: mastermind-like protein 1 [Latimeria chalumnae]|eukprot:XP_005995392.1 PREDICTED: mastermind-like protein 1 [Latimeria chalumnae]
MADFVVPRHSVVVERLRRRIERCRGHHNSCESRYEAVSAERRELERQHTYLLHQRCLQAKAKRTVKHRHQQGPPEQGGSRGSGGASSDTADTGSGEQNRNSTLIALQKTVKRKLENAASPQNGDHQNGFVDPFSLPKKICLEEPLGGVNGSSNGMPPVSPLHPLDIKPSVRDGTQMNGNHSLGPDGLSKSNCLPDSNLQVNESKEAGDGYSLSLNKEMKQEPMEDLPCMLSSVGGSMAPSNLMPDLNLNEQEWKELIEELNRSVPDEDMQDLFNEDFEEKKDSDPPGSTEPSSLQQDGIHIKTEFSPANFEQEQMGSPQVKSLPTGPSFLGTSSAPASVASPVMASALAVSQPSSNPMAQTPNQTIAQASSQSQASQRPMSNVIMPGQGTGASKELSQTQHLQQIAASHRAAQLMQSQRAPKFHQPNQMPNWSQAGLSHSPLGGPYGMEKPNSPSLYQQDLNSQKLMMTNMATKSSPRTGSNYLQPNHLNMMGHGANGMNQSPVSSQSGVLNYGNTKPLTHFEVDCGQGTAPAAQSKVVTLSYLQQQRQQAVSHITEEQKRMLMKQKPGISYRPVVPHNQDQNAASSIPRVPGSVPGPGVSVQPQTVSMASNHGNGGYLGSQQQVVVMKQQQQILLEKQKQREQQHQQQLILEQKKQFLMGQRQQQQLLADQEKQRQEQQLQRHLTRPPPQYQDQQQNPYQQQQQAAQFQGSSQGLPGVSNLGPANSSSPRMFTQNPGMMQMGAGQSTVPPTSAASGQQDMVVPPYNSMQNVQQGAMYSRVNQMLPHGTQGSMGNGQTQVQRQSSLGQGGSLPAGYGQNLLGNASLPQQQQQQTSKGPGNLALAKPQMARMPNAMGAQNTAWQHQAMVNMNSQTQGNNGLRAFNPSTTFHMQQAHPKMANQQFAQGMAQATLSASRPMASMNSSVSGQMMSSLVGGQHRPNPPTQQPQVMPSMNQPVSDMTAYGQAQSQPPASRASLHCRQGYQVRTANQELPFVYGSQSGNGGLQSLPGDAELMDSLLKNRTSDDEWMKDLDEFLGNH